MSKSTTEVRQSFIDFFYSKQHQVVASSSLVPDNDSTLLFTNAGMNQFKNLFLGLDSRPYRRATTAQRCVRAGGKHNDLENVGYTTRHHTFFEMLGNFSFGDYFKHEAILFAWELLTGKQWFNLQPERIWVTVCATDEEAYNIWDCEVGIPSCRIIRIEGNKDSNCPSDNFWQMGNTGPCGPCSEIFYDHGSDILGDPPGTTNGNGDRYIEIWNLVFMQFNRQTDGTLIPLPKPSVDTGMGLERISAILQGVHSNYDIDIFKILIFAAADVTGSIDSSNMSLRVIADHIRSCTSLISDGVVSSNYGKGYVLRRLIRRAVRHGRILGVKDVFFYKLVAPFIEVMDGYGSYIKPQRSLIEHVLRVEEEQFIRTLDRGLIKLNEEIAKLNGDTIDGKTVFRLSDTYGVPFDLIVDICRERNLLVDEPGFNSAMDSQRALSRSSNNFHTNYNSLLRINKTTDFLGYKDLEHKGIITAFFIDNQPVNVLNQGEEAIIVLNETPFYGESGGQVGDTGWLKSSSSVFEVLDTKKYGKAFGHHGNVKHGRFKLGSCITAQVNREYRENICRNHSATHLLHAALRQELGKHVWQKGSLINDQYLRFDFSYHKPMQFNQIRQVEKVVNKKIQQNFLIETEIMSPELARKKGAISLFNAKYEAQVRVLIIGDFSVELCGGTHTNRTGNIGLFRIINESGISAGIRRIEAVTGESALASLYQQDSILHRVSKLMNSNFQSLEEKVLALQDYSSQLAKNLQQLKNQELTQITSCLVHKVRDIKGIKVLVSQLDSIPLKMLRNMVDNLKNKLGTAVIILATIIDKKSIFIVGITKNLVDRLNACEIVNYLVDQVGGKGGGRIDLAQAGGIDVSALPFALASVDKMLTLKISTEQE